MQSKITGWKLVGAAASIAIVGALAARRVSASPVMALWTEIADTGSIPKAQTLPDFVDLAAKLSPAVVGVSSVENPKESEQSLLRKSPHGMFEEFTPHSRSLGSGFIIAKEGYILTNDHVVDSDEHAGEARPGSHPGRINENITVTTQDGRTFAAKVVGRDTKTDVALLKIEAGHDLAVAPLGNSDGVKVGQWVMAIGNPFGFDHSVTVGIVSAKGRFVAGSYDEFIQTDASINMGNSGGPLIDLRGEVVGVNSAIYTSSGANLGIGFAIPVNLIKDELSQLRDTGKVVRGWLGVYIQNITPDLADSLGLSEAHGALVAEVLKDGPAKNAGLKRGDVIVAFNNASISDSHQLPLLVGRTALGSTASIRIVREKHTIDLPITITESHEMQMASASMPSEKPDFEATGPFGLRVKDLDTESAKELGIDAQNGVVVSFVQPGSRGDEAGLRARDVILEVNRAAVKDVSAFDSALKDSTRGRIVLMLVKRGQTTQYVAIKPEA
jgi:serine protease Do